MPPDVVSLPRSRSVSLSSDVAPSITGVLSPPPVDPAPAFIAASAASQIVGADLEQNGLISSADGDSALVTPGSLALLNGFLDYLLYNILAVAKSTQLSALRPAIAEVLKPRLAKEVVSAADEELSEYMGGGEDEELLEFHGGQEPRGEFDLIRSWKLTRLRCMVYTRLGDLEEEEEDEYIAREGLDETGGAPRRFASHVGNITPAAAIFLTSIIEYLGEHALVLAGENARSRSPRIRDGQPDSPVGSDVRLVVEECDMEKLALNSTLGRLWRIWRKRVKGPTLSRTLSRESFARRGIASSRKSSIVTIDGRDEREIPFERAVEEEEEHVDPTSVALRTENDMKENEVPGLVVDVDGEIETMQATVAQKVRPRSLMVSNTGLLTPTSPTSSTGGSPNTTHSASDSTFSRHSRARSLPIPPNAILTPSSNDGDGTNNGESTRSPKERPSLETMYENDENETGPVEVSNPRETAAPESAGPEDVEREQRRSGEHATAQQADGRGDLAKLGRDHRGDEVEVIEGQGTYEIPKLSSLPAQRPKRKSSKETTRRDNRSTYVLESRDSPTGYRDDHAPPTQGVDPVPTSPQQKDGYADDRLRSGSVRAQDEGISSATSPTSHARQLEGASALSVPSAEAEAADGCPRSPLSASRHASSNYSESIGAPQSTSDESESVSRSRTPSQATSQPASSGGQSRPGQGDLSAGTERAAVQRVMVSSTSQTSSISKSRRSESIGSTKRPQTAGSTASTVSSKLRGLIGRHPAEGDNPPPPRVRASSDASRKSSGSDELADDKSDLDRLIKSNETIHYTLTPRNMREMEAPGSPRWNAARTDTSELANFPKNTAPPGDVPSPRPKTTPSTPPPRINGLRAHPPTPPSGSKPSSIDIRSSSPTSQRSSTRPKMYQPRDAKPAAESLRDFADFIRSTGPPGSMQGPANPPSGSLRTHYRDTSGSVVSNTRSETPQSSNSSRATAKPKETESPRKSGPRLQPRAAVASEGNQTSDLIDFIREGPPTAGAHRIPRTVAPFRTTMDSDEFQSLDVARIDKDTAAQTTAADSSTQPNSLRSSVNSRAPLLESSNSSNAPAGPVRKQRRVRDPYAIDSDDEDDLDDLAENSKGKPQREEESLLDFLNSVPPPPGNDRPPQPFSINVPPKSSGGISTASGMRARFRRNTSVDKTPVPKPSMTSIRSRKSTNSASGVPFAGPASSVVSIASGAQANANAQFDNPASGSSDYAAIVNRERVGGSNSSYGPSGGARVLQRQTETSALADFLRNTGPPEPPPMRTASSMSEDRKDPSALSRLFRRGKKVEV
ncbi:hypothetical protein VTN77DRAFT_3915 [Rasamsonia byssochlamydoides]|uniref:uncharacterized protein n=1 Tax=Rasamsonia byssochlamydoides TaxID=89139 RepID=UPI0037425ED4